ncbi:phosphotransferase family protein [Catenuloplanes japonicus]|uniref:phosphotransferase family protein n=1 Tax=Catenuloplanes japonicus TaxID=33876 RepID=UPI00052703BB|nr:aminoglycoside phosphotransferase family protein [Catenuloplanes japonicus]
MGGDEAWARTLLPDGVKILRTETLAGGWSSLVRRLALSDGTALVLRSMRRPELAARAVDMIRREAAMLRLLAPTDIPVPRLLGVRLDAPHPSLLMTHIPGQTHVGTEGAPARAAALAAQVTRIHRFRPPPSLRPPLYTAWAWPGEIRYPDGTARRAMWQHAEHLITRDPPPFTGRFLHRDFHLGNVLFGPSGEVTGVIDWTDASWGPADLDIGHCATMLALLHDDALAESFVDACGPRGEHHLYWRLLSALAFAPDAANAGGPWRALGRTDRTPAVLRDALERHLEYLLDTFE